MATQIHPMMTQNEFQALMYLAVGVKSEDSLGERSVAYKLSLAGNIDSDGTMHPKDNSGSYSFGKFQIDLGQRRSGKNNVFSALIGNYQAWVQQQYLDWVLNPNQEQEARHKLQR